MYGPGGLRGAERITGVLSVIGLDWAEDELSSRSGVTGRSKYIEFPLTLDSVDVIESALRWLAPLL